MFDSFQSLFSYDSVSLTASNMLMVIDLYVYLPEKKKSCIWTGAF